MDRFWLVSAVSVFVSLTGLSVPPAGGRAPNHVNEPRRVRSNVKPMTAPGAKAPEHKPASTRTEGGVHRPMPSKPVVQSGDRPRNRHSGMRHESRRERYDRRLMELIENAESLGQLRAIVTEAAQSHNPEIRLAMIDALEDKGRRAVDELAAFIGDPDDEVSDSAWRAWSSVVENMDDREARLRAIHSAGFLLQNVR